MGASISTTSRAKIALAILEIVRTKMMNFLIVSFEQKVAQIRCIFLVFFWLRSRVSPKGANTAPPHYKQRALAIGARQTCTRHTTASEQRQQHHGGGCSHCHRCHLLKKRILKEVHVSGLSSLYQFSNLLKFCRWTQVSVLPISATIPTPFFVTRASHVIAPLSSSVN
jgi:hypothetical protein